MSISLSHIEAAPGDPILGVTELFLRDQNPQKVNLGVGIYQDSAGRSSILPSIMEAQRRVLAKEQTKSYLPIDGLAEFNKSSQQLIFGKDSESVNDKRVSTVQTPAGSGALRLAGDFLHSFFPRATLWVSNPTWDNHRALFEAAHLTIQTYPYWDAETCGLDEAAMLASLQEIPQGDAILLHACCHNPTGVDLSKEVWSKVHSIIRSRELIPIIDFAYQGFGEGIEEDAFGVRLLARDRKPLVVASSCSKNFGLYRERLGTLSIACADANEATRVTSQLKRIIRTIYSSPPSHGALVVQEIMSDQGLLAQWKGELDQMRKRILGMRKLLVSNLASEGLDRDFSFMLRQRGMFSYSGIPENAVLAMRKEWGVYMLTTGRICLAALNESNIAYVAKAIATSLKTV